ncbi:MAG: hypothetical protein NXI28_05485 [bacterium]|nr:hypothetical protein [bacterium]
MDRVVVDIDVLSFYLKNDSRFLCYVQALDGKQLVISFQTLAELMLWQEVHGWGQQRRDDMARLSFAYHSSSVVAALESVHCPAE